MVCSSPVRSVLARTGGMGSAVGVGFCAGGGLAEGGGRDGACGEGEEGTTVHG